LTDQGLTKSNSEARRLIGQGGVWVNGEKVSDADLHIEAGTHLIQVGKRRFLEVTIGG
jgi:tyrosyl-tRNA synthetase